MFVTRRAEADIIVLEGKIGTVLVRVQRCERGHVILGFDCDSGVLISIVEAQEIASGPKNHHDKPVRLAGDSPLGAGRVRRCRSVEPKPV